MDFQVKSALLLLFLIVSSTLAVDWSTITTAEEMKKLDFEDFSEMSVDDAKLVSKHPAACAGISRNDMNFMPKDTASGFSPECVLNFTVDACSSVRDWTYYQQDVISKGITAQCMAHSDIYSLNHVTRGQAGSIPVSTCKGITGIRYENMPKSVTDYLSDGCKGVLTFIDIKWVDVKTSTMLNNIPKQRFESINASDISTILKNDAEICSGFRESQVVVIPKTEFKAFTANCVSKFDSETCYLNNDETIWRQFPITVFSGIQSDCLNNIPSEFWTTATKEFGTLIQPKACEGFSYDDFQIMSSDMLGSLTKVCASYFTKDGCSAIDKEQIAKLTANAFSGLTGQCVEGWDHLDVSLETLNQYQFGALNSDACEHLSKHYLLVMSIPYEAFAGLTVQCFSSFDKGGSKYISGDNFPYLSADVINYFNATDISAMDDYVFLKATAINISHLNPPACKGITVKQLAKMNDSAFSGLTPQCFTMLNPDSCIGINGDKLKMVKPETFSGITAYMEWKWRAKCLMSKKWSCMG